MKIKIEIFQSIKGSGDYLIVGETRYMTYLADLLQKIYERNRRNNKFAQRMAHLFRELKTVRISGETMKLLVETLVAYGEIRSVETQAYKISQFFKERINV